MMSDVVTANDSSYKLLFDPANIVPREVAATVTAQLSDPSSIRFLFGGEDEEEEKDDPWAKHNWEAISKIPHFTGMLSFLGSGWIIARVLCDAQRRKQVYHRLMLALSTFDFFLSFWMFMSTWAQPQPKVDWLSTSCEECNGTVRTCEASGFFITLGSIAIPLYNVALSVYYYLAICIGCPERTLKSNFEKYVHLTIPIISLVVATIPLPLDLYNPYYFFCSATAADYNNDTETFDRGTMLGMRAYIFLVFSIVMVSGICMVVLMALICFKVSRLEKRSMRYGEAFSSKQTKTPTCSSIRSGRRPSNTATRSRSKAVVIRALLYTVPFYLTWIIPTTKFVKAQICLTGINYDSCPGPATEYFLQVWIAVFMPLQGFFNAVIYDAIPYFTKRNRKRENNRRSSLFVNAPEGAGNKRINLSKEMVSSCGSFEIKEDEISKSSHCSKNESKTIEFVVNQESSDDSNTQIQQVNNPEESHNSTTNDNKNENDEMDKNIGADDLVTVVTTGEDRV